MAAFLRSHVTSYVVKSLSREMAMNPGERLREINSTKDLIYGSYVECMTRSFLSGLSAFTIVFTGTFFGQRVILGKISSSYSKKKTLFVATAAASLISYYVASKRIKSCQKSFKTNE